MEYATQSTLLTWIVFVPVIGIGLILAILAARPFAKLRQEFVDDASRLIGLASTVIVALNAQLLRRWRREPDATLR